MNTKLSTKPLDRNYFVNNNVIYEIKSYEITSDEHAIHVGKDSNEEKIPKIKVTKTFDDSGDEKIYYLDSLVEDGDKLNINATAQSFKKTNHIFSPEDEEDFFTYYTKMCKYVIGQKLADLKDYPYEYFVENKVNFSIPAFMIDYNGYTLEVADGGDFDYAVPIQFTEDLYNKLKDEAIQQRILEAAKKEASKYKYKVNSVDAEKI